MREHKHKDLLIAYANNADLQFEIKISGYWHDLMPDDSGELTFYESEEYRIKILYEYKVALLEGESGGYVLHTVLKINGNPDSHPKKTQLKFIKWLTDWTAFDPTTKD